MNKVAIVTDSTSAIPDSIARENNLTIVPLNLIWDGKTYLDGIEITPTKFYEMLIKSDTLPTTSQPSVGMFVEIEAGGEENLKSTVEKLGLMNCPLESRNYGQIIRETTAGNNRLMFK